MGQHLHSEIVHRRLLALGLGLLLFFQGSCAEKSSPSPSVSQKKTVLCTAYPIYLFAKNILAESETLEARLLLPPGLGCPHDYALTPQDMQKIAHADYLAINGLGLEEFLGEPIQRANPTLQILDASRDIQETSLLPEEEEEAAEHVHLAGAHWNPHLFASPGRAAVQIKTLANEFSKIAPAEKALFEKNAAHDMAALEALALEWKNKCAPYQGTKIALVHTALTYLLNDAGLKVAIIIEAHPGQDPSASHLMALLGEIHQQGIQAVVQEPQYPSRTGATLAKEAGIPCLELDPVASGPEVVPANYYETVMRRNLLTLLQALERKTP